MPISPKIFKAYDIRGVVPNEINPEVGFAVGTAFAEFIRGRYRVEKPKIIVSRDARISSPEIAGEVRRGLTGAGADVIDAGLTTTPMHYWIVGTEEADGGIMVTASHNPKEYNGFKLTGRGALPFGGEDGLPEIRSLIENGAPASSTRGASSEQSYLDRYIDFLVKKFPSLPALRLAVDASNGAAGGILAELFKHFPALSVTPLFWEPDGAFPNHEPNPLKDEAIADLQKAVKNTNADLGIIFDADGDRVMFVDEKARRIPSDVLVALFADHVLAYMPGEAIVYNVSCGRVVREVVEERGGKPILSRTGHFYMGRAMKEHNAVFGGEHSGHFYFRDTFFRESAMLAMLSLLAQLCEKKISVSELIKPYQRYIPSGEINYEVHDWPAVAEKLKREFQSEALDFTDGISVESKSWRFNIRPSNTEPFVRVNAEAGTRGEFDALVRRLSEVIKRA